MEPREYEIMHLAEDLHWWYKGMAAITRSIMERYYARGQGLRILDAGCGTGAGMAWLSDYGKVTGCDISAHAIHLCGQRGNKGLARASVMALPFGKQTFDVVVSLDVLYFLNVDDVKALEEFARVLIPGGRVLLRVPAFDWLRGIHDVKVSTGHRYTRKELSEKMSKCGLTPLIMSYANTLLFPLVLAKRFFDRWLAFQKESDISIRTGFLDKCFETCLVLESRLIAKHSLPFGVSITGIGQKAF